MWDLTVPGNDDHDFYVFPTTSTRPTGQHTYYAEAGTASVLVHNEPSCGPQLNYQANPKHANGVLGSPVGPEPANPQGMLNESFLFNGNSGRRIAYDAVNGQIDVFAPSGGGTYHGYVSTWSDLPADARRVLIKQGIFNAKGRYLR
jgi:hypothetical protein